MTGLPSLNGVQQGDAAMAAFEPPRDERACTTCSFGVE